MIANVAIRLAVPGDAPGIALMSRELIEYGLPWNWRTERVANAIASAHTNVAVVGLPGSAAAFGIMEYLEEDAHLVLFAVQHAQQRQGVGSALLQWLEAAARASGAQRVRVEARRENDQARTFYNEHGYHERTIDLAMYNGTVDGIRLEKWLRAPSAAPDPG